MQIINQGGNYLLVLKGNQSNLHNEIINYFEQVKEYGVEGRDYQIFEEKNKDHGRKETRKIFVTNQIDFLPQKNEWKNLQSIVCLSSKRIVNNKISKENCYYITSLDTSAKKIGEAIRKHWAIENILHWVLDVSFRENQSRIRKGNGPENMAIMRHCAINMIRRFKNKRQSIKELKKQAAWDEEILKGILDMAS